MTLMMEISLTHGETTSCTEERKIACVGNRIESRALFLNQREIVIVHNDEEYRLSITGNQKLILTK